MFAVTLKLTKLVTFPPPTSLLEATSVRALTALPVYTASRVSKLLPAVETVAVPEASAVKYHHTDLPPALPAWFGSPDSLVALKLLPDWGTLP